MAYAKITLVVNSDWEEPLDHVLQILEHTDQAGDLTAMGLLRAIEDLDVMDSDTEKLELIPARRIAPIKTEDLARSVSVLEKFLANMDTDPNPDPDTLAAISNTATEIIDQAEASIHQISKEERS
jgi:hypothetical protein|tara:strand:- start:2254 stop:2628 length:375 start_codon:yes stop_codon:yes gene_type:complete